MGVEVTALDALVEETYATLLKVLREDHVSRNTTVQTFVIVLAPAGPKFALIFDPASILTDVKLAVRTTPDAHGFICVHDGHIVGEDGPKEALLFIWGTKSGKLTARAFPYERTVFGARFDDSKQFEPKGALLSQFQGVFL